MNMKRFVSGLLSAALALSLTACGPSPDGSTSGSSASAPVSSVPKEPDQAQAAPFSLAFFPKSSLHPVLGRIRSNLSLAPLLYEPLFQVNESFEAVPVLCKSYHVSPDKLVWTLELRSEPVFSDGTALTGQVVADALSLAKTEGSRYADRLQDVVGLSAQGSTLTITLSRPNGSLPLLLDIPIAIGGGDRPVGTGPYVLGGTEDAPCLTARSDWWQSGIDLPARQFPLQAAHRNDDLIHAFDAGDLSLMEVDLLGTGTLGYTANSEVWDFPTTTLLYLGFNTQRGLCRRADVRQALCRAVDRETLTNSIYAHHAVPSPLPVHPGSPRYDRAAAEKLDFDPQRLLDLLAGTSTASRELVLLVNQENTAKVSAAQLIAYQLETAGVPVRLKKLPFEEFLAHLAAGSFDLYLGEVTLTADFDLHPLLAPGAPLNYSGWSSEQAPALLAALSAASPEEAPKAASALFTLLEQDPPLAALCFKNGSVLTQWGRLEGLSPVRGNVFYQLENWIMK